MIVGVLQAELRIEWARSLKDKRSVARSLRDRLSRSYRVSVSEVGAQDIHNTLLLGVAVAGSSAPQVAGVLDTVVHTLASEHDCELVACQRELLTGWAGELSGGSFTSEECDRLAGEMLDRFDDSNAEDAA